MLGHAPDLRPLVAMARAAPGGYGERLVTILSDTPEPITSLRGPDGVGLLLACCRTMLDEMPHVTVHANFFEDLRRLLCELMTERGWNLPDRNTDLQEVCLAYLEGVHRQIQPMPRRVYWSTVLEAKRAVFSADVLLGLQTIEAEVLAGDDLGARLSKATKFPADREKLDMLLSDWGFYHLHVGSRVPGREFTERSALVLFVRVTADAMYFVDVMLHGSHAPVAPWYLGKLNEIVLQNWSHLLIKSHIPGGMPTTPEDVRTARAKGFVTLWQGSDGANYFPAGGGYSAARVSIMVVTQMDRLLDEVQVLERLCRGGAADIARKLGEHAGVALSELHLELRLDADGRFLVEETKTGLRCIVTHDAQQTNPPEMAVAAAMAT